jgi:hypothetical protein
VILTCGAKSSPLGTEESEGTGDGGTDDTPVPWLVLTGVGVVSERTENTDVDYGLVTIISALRDPLTNTHQATESTRT